MKLLKGKLGLVIVGLAIGAAGMFGASQVLGDSLPFVKPQPAAASAKPAAAKKPVEEEGMMVPLKERVVNLADTGVMRYLKTTIVLEMVAEGPLPKGEEYKKKQDKLVKEMGGAMPIIEDRVTTILSGKTAADLMTNDGKQKLRDEIKTSVNKALHGKEEVLAVYFSEFIIQ